ncbi:MAG: type III glutamate--ammonia ligase, partial [Pseudomonadota bacterium]|nr:type III glutamate--ammonia ligase [Pseudomonadota bacterium]
ANTRDPRTRLDIDMDAEPQNTGRAKKLPLNLLDALRLTEKSKVLRAGLGDEVIDSYIKLKMQEWEDYCQHLTQWERDHTLDC